ncbi:glycosyl transferase, group 1 [Rivularia sp. IAM M-261]|nr:glycosyl transferase, group 1 [Rivularia sp. IAM M-261]
MNILHINRFDIGDGAGIAAYRLHQGLLAQAFNSRLLVGRSTISDDKIASIPDKYGIVTKLNQQMWRLGLSNISVLNTFDIHKHIFYQEADILNFHSLLSGYFNYLAIPSLTVNKPSILTLHDMWSFTGHCCYSYECDRWQNGCGKCPYPDDFPAIGMDNTHIEWKLKNWAYSRSKLTIVAPSNWLMKQAQKSILNRFSIYHIPHGIDTQAYQPLDTKRCRSILGIPLGKKVLMFGAIHLNDSRKGGDLVLKALQSLPKSLKAETVLLIMGNTGNTISQAVGMPTLNLGYLSNDRIKSIAYSAADLFLFTSRAEAFGLVAQEALSCGTPIVAFNVGGIPDLVRPGVTGYLAEPENVQDLCNGIIKLLEDEKLRESIAQNCRAITLKEYSLELQAQRYIELYNKVL